MRTYSEADAECKSRGTLLAEINNEQDELSVSRELAKLGVGQAWIGGQIDAGEWRWISSKIYTDLLI